MGCVGLWRDFPATLATRLNRPILAYDRLGFGQSTAHPNPPSFNFMHEEADLYFPALKTQLNIDHYILFGYSVGGSISIHIAAKDSDCQAVVTESSQAFVEDHTIRGVQVARTEFRQPDRLQKLAKWHGDKVAWILDAWTELWLDPRFADWSLAPVLPNVKCPILAIHGDRDDYGTIAFPELICRYAGGPCQMALLSDTGHMPHREREAEVLDLVDRFVN